MSSQPRSPLRHLQDATNDTALLRLMLGMFTIVDDSLIYIGPGEIDVRDILLPEHVAALIARKRQIAMPEVIKALGGMTLDA